MSAAAWTAGEVDVDSPAGRYLRPCHSNAAAPGLCVNRRWDEGEDKGWVVTHVRSGRYILPEQPTQKAARAFALNLAKLGDWSRSGEEILADEQLRAAVIQLRGAP